MAGNAKASLLDYLRACFWLVTCVFMAVLAAPVLGEIEGRVFPVVREFTLEQRDADDHAVRVAGEMRKVRDCRILGLTAHVGNDYNRLSRRERLDVTVRGQPANRVADRPPGRQSWGPWEVARPDRVPGPDLWVVVRHRCHPLWETTTTVVNTEAHRVFGAEPDVMDLYDIAHE